MFYDRMLGNRAFIFYHLSNSTILITQVYVYHSPHNKPHI